MGVSGQSGSGRSAGLIVLCLVMTVSSGILVFSLSEEPEERTGSVDATPVVYSSPGEYHGGPVVIVGGANWVTQSGRLVERSVEGKPTKWLEVGVHGAPDRAERFCTLLLQAHGKDSREKGEGLPTCRRRELSTAAWLAEAGEGWLLEQPLTTDLLRITVADMEPGADPMLLDFAVMRGVLSSKYSAETDPFTGQRRVDRVVARRVRSFPDEQACRQALDGMQDAAKPGQVERDMSTLERLISEQRDRLEKVCTPEESETAGQSRCQISRLNLEHLEAHLAKRLRSEPLPPAVCRPIRGLLEASPR